ncbi:MAG: polyphosphate polymerase domain-containing protein [Bacteroidia bacterium]
MNIETQIINVLKQFNPISLTEMDKVALMKRVDTKYVLTDAQLLEILPNIKKAYSSLQIDDRRLMKYNSQYFDTDSYDFYLQHHRGKAGRIKIRKRCYVDSGLCFLEIKRKNKKGATIKKRIKVDELDGFITNNEQSFLISSKMPNVDLVPTLSNSFSRITLVNKHSVERLTIDLGLQFNYGEPIKGPKGGLVIVEVKQPELDRNSPIIKELRHLGLRPQSMSKYCVGVALNIASIKHNRFKKHLNLINKKIA